MQQLRTACCKSQLKKKSSTIFSSIAQSKEEGEPWRNSKVTIVWPEQDSKFWVMPRFWFATGMIQFRYRIVCVYIYIRTRAMIAILPRIHYRGRIVIAIRPRSRDRNSVMDQNCDSAADHDHPRRREILACRCQSRVETV